MDEECDYLGKRKKRRHDGCSSGAGRTESHDSTIADGGGGRFGDGVGSLPSKEAMASRGLEAKVDMATHGQTSWALTSLGAWREQSLSSSGGGKSTEFVKSRQREVRRAMMLGAAGAAAAAAAAAAATARTEGSVGACLSGADDMAVG